MPRQMINLPDPLIYRRRQCTGRKLSKDEKASKTPYLMVPRFFDLYHPVTSWLIHTVVTENERELDRVLIDKKVNGLLKFEPDPAATQAQRTMMEPSDLVITKAKYFQILDRPDMYDPENLHGPLFHRHAVLYLTPLGLAIYLRKHKVVRQLLACINRDTNRKHVLARQLQFVTCLSDRYGDIMCLYDHNLAMLSETFDILHLMLVHSNWFPMEPFKLVYRKQHVETTSAFDDFLDYAFYILLTKRSSFSMARLAETLLEHRTEHFVLNYMSQPSRATRFTLLRDAGRVINNCKTYPRRILRCAYYADKTLKSTQNLIRAAEAFAHSGMFKPPGGEPVLPFIAREGRRKRLEALPAYKHRSRYPYISWPASLYEFDCDCCIALLCGLLYKCQLVNKMAPFQSGLKLATKLLADSGWLDYFSRVSDLELRDYFMGLDDAERLRVRPTIMSHVRECVKLTVLEKRLNLTEFFSEARICDSIRSDADLMNNDTLCGMVLCHADIVQHYVSVKKGDKLTLKGSVICGARTRDEGRDDPNNRFYMDRLVFPAESTRTVMINTANVEDSPNCSESTPQSTSTEADSAELNCSNCSSAKWSNDSRRQSVRELATLRLLDDSATGTAAPFLTVTTPFRTMTSASDGRTGVTAKPSRLPVFQWRAFKERQRGMSCTIRHDPIPK